MNVNDIVDSLRMCSKILALPDKSVAEIITEVSERLEEIQSHIEEALEVHVKNSNED